MQAMREMREPNRGRRVGTREEARRARSMLRRSRIIVARPLSSRGGQIRWNALVATS